MSAPEKRLNPVVFTNSENDGDLRNFGPIVSKVTNEEAAEESPKDESVTEGAKIAEGIQLDQESLRGIKKSSVVMSANSVSKKSNLPTVDG